MYNDTRDGLASKDTAPLGYTPHNHSIPEHNGEASIEYCKDLNPPHDMVELQEHFQ